MGSLGSLIKGFFLEEDKSSPSPKKGRKTTNALSSPSPSKEVWRGDILYPAPPPFVKEHGGALEEAEKGIDGSMMELWGKVKENVTMPPSCFCLEVEKGDEGEGETYWEKIFIEKIEIKLEGAILRFTFIFNKPLSISLRGWVTPIGHYFQKKVSVREIKNYSYYGSVRLDIHLEEEEKET
mgnify:CR=1 FL=1